MKNVSYSFNNEMRELFDYPDPYIPLVVWRGDFSNYIDRSLTYHWHNEFEYCVVTDGTIGFVIDGNYIEVNCGQVVFINSGAMHSMTQIGEVSAKIYTVSFLPTVLTDNEHSTVYRKHFLPIIKSSVRGFVIDNGKNMPKEF